MWIVNWGLRVSKSFLDLTQAFQELKKAKKIVWLSIDTYVLQPTLINAKINEEAVLFF